MYNFTFASMISPNFLSSTFTFMSNNDDYKKIQVKQSYILFTWFYHLSVFKKKKKIFKFFILPIQKKITTQVKAPMAHKTWSKEQFSYKFYLIRISFFNFFLSSYRVSSINAGLLFVILSKNHFPTFETNILFLKNYKFFFYLNEKKYFNYYLFSK